MHIPENYLSPSTCAVMGAAMIPVWTRSVKKVKEEITKEKMPMLGVGAAFSFLVMMLNVPLPGGTTGHAVGGALIALLLGPYAACISITIALVIQALLFGDGGILAIGANCFNMAFILPFSAYYIHNFIKSKVKSQKAEYIGAFVAGYIALNLAALFTAIEFGLQPMLFKDSAGLPLYCPYDLSIAVPSMMIPHLLVAGIVEAVVTSAVYTYVRKASADMIYKGKKIKPVYGFILALIILSPIGLLAEGTAWGEWGAEEISEIVTNGKILGFVPKGMENGFNFEAIIPDYAVNGIPEVLGYVLSAILGVAIILILFKFIARNKSSRNSINQEL